MREVLMEMGGLEVVVVPDFKGHHFERSASSRVGWQRYRCEYCGMLAQEHDHTLGFWPGGEVVTDSLESVLESSKVPVCSHRV